MEAMDGARILAASLLMMAALAGLYFEFSNPGLILPGVVGAICLLLALMAEYPGVEWAVPALCPEEIGAIFQSVGFEPGDLSQFHMVKEWT